MQPVTIAPAGLPIAAVPLQSNFGVPVAGNPYNTPPLPIGKLPIAPTPLPGLLPARPVQPINPGLPINPYPPRPAPVGPGYVPPFAPVPVPVPVPVNPYPGYINPNPAPVNPYPGYANPGQGSFNPIPPVQGLGYVGREDCVCVPIGQCSSYVNPQNKDYQVDYQIDPRTLDKGILAEDVAEENSTTSTTPATRRRRDLEQIIAEEVGEEKTEGNEDGERKGRILTGKRQFVNTCGPNQVCCPSAGGKQGKDFPTQLTCGRRNPLGLDARIKTQAHVDGDAEFGKKLNHIPTIKSNH